MPNTENLLIGSDSRNFTMDHVTHCEICHKEIWIHGQPKVLKDLGFHMVCKADGIKKTKI